MCYDMLAYSTSKPQTEGIIKAHARTQQSQESQTVKASNIVAFPYLQAVTIIIILQTLINVFVNQIINFHYY